MHKRHKVVVTGYAMASPFGEDMSTQTNAIFTGQSAYSPITRFNTNGTHVRHGAEAERIDPRSFPDRKVKKMLSPKDQLSLKTIINAASHAKLPQLPPESIGLFVGAGNTWLGDLIPYLTLLKYCIDEETTTYSSREFGARLLDEINPILVTQALLNNSLCFGSKTIDARGPNGNYMNFEISSLQAIGEAFRCLEAGRANVCLAGGFSPTLEAFNVNEAHHDLKYARTDTSEEKLSELAKPYDAKRQGAIASEAAGYLVLERYEHAKERGATIYAEIDSFFTAADGYVPLRQSIRPARGLSRALGLALEESEWSSDSIDTVWGSGSGSRQDTAELMALDQTLTGPVSLTSIKGRFGETEEAGSVISAIAALEATQQGSVPPTFNLKEPAIKCQHLSVLQEKQATRSGRMIVTGTSRLGLGGVLLFSCHTSHT